MEETPSKSIKYILTTYEDGGNNHYYDSIFNLRVPFSPNRNGAYRVEFNELMFKNNEETLIGGRDYFDIAIHLAPQSYDDYYDEEVIVTRYTVKRSVYTYGSDYQFPTITFILTGNEYYVTQSQFVENTRTYNDGRVVHETYPLVEDDSVNIELFLNDSSSGEKFTKVSSVYYRHVLRLGMKITGDYNYKTLNYGTSYISYVGIRYSSNFGYMLNNMSAECKCTTGQFTWTDTDSETTYLAAANGDQIEYEEEEEEAEEDPDETVYHDELLGTTHTVNGYYFKFYNPRFSGAYIYIADTTINADVKTYNANNQAYNIVALSYNYASSHNSPIQCNSTMSGTSSDLSNLRIRLLNDQFEPVQIKESIYIQITVSNTD